MNRMHQCSLSASRTIKRRPLMYQSCVGQTIRSLSSTTIPSSSSLQLNGDSLSSYRFITSYNGLAANRNTSIQRIRWNSSSNSNLDVYTDEQRKQDHRHCVELVQTRDMEGYRECFVYIWIYKMCHLLCNVSWIDTSSSIWLISHIPLPYLFIYLAKWFIY